MKKSLIASFFLLFELQYAVANNHVDPYNNRWFRTDCFGIGDYDYNGPYYIPDDYAEVIYLPPEKIENIIDFLNKISTPGPGRTVQTRSTEAPTTTPTEETTSMTPRYIEKTTTVPTFNEISPTQSTTTLKETDTEEIEAPIEDIVNSDPFKNEIGKTSTTYYEIPPEPYPEEMDNEDDSDLERDSEEDILSVKKPEKISEPSEDENNSKPKDIYRWFRS